MYHVIKKDWCLRNEIYTLIPYKQDLYFLSDSGIKKLNIYTLESNSDKEKTSIIEKLDLFDNGLIFDSKDQRITYMLLDYDENIILFNQDLCVAHKFFINPKREKYFDDFKRMIDNCSVKLNLPLSIKGTLVSVYKEILELRLNKDSFNLLIT